MTKITINAYVFREIIKKLQPFQSTDKTRYAICGEYVQRIGNKLVIVATNSYMLAEDTMVIQAESDSGDFAFTISADDIKNLIQLLDEKKRRFVDVIYEGGKITVDCPDYTYSFREVDSRFPEYRHVMPEGKKHLMLPAAKRSHLFTALIAIGEAECVDIGYSDAVSPFMLTASPDSPFKIVIMPVHIGLQIAESGGINA